MLYDLLHMDISKVDFSKPPMTAGLVQQMRQGFSQEDKWYESILIDGRIPFRDGILPTDFVSDFEWGATGGLVIAKDALLASFRDFVPGFRSPPTNQVLGTFMGKRIPSLKQSKHGPAGNRIPVYILPPLAEMRAAFLSANPGYDFPTEIEEDETHQLCQMLWHSTPPLSGRGATRR